MADRAEELADEIERSIEFYALAGVDEVPYDLSPKDAPIVVTALRDAYTLRAENARLRAMLREAGEVLTDAIEGKEIAAQLADNIRSKGNYSAGSMITYLGAISFGLGSARDLSSRIEETLGHE